MAALGDPLVLVNSAGGNVKQRHWGNLAPASASEVIDLDLKAMFYCTLAALPVMRARGDGTNRPYRLAGGVSLTPITGPSYMAAKHAVVALSRSLNAEEGIHGIRSICLSPGEVETPILNTRPVPPTAEERALMLQPQDVVEVALFCATLPRRACVTELVLLPTDDPLVRAQADAIETPVGAPLPSSLAKSFGCREIRMRAGSGAVPPATRMDAAHQRRTASQSMPATVPPWNYSRAQRKGPSCRRRRRRRDRGSAVRNPSAPPGSPGADAFPVRRQGLQVLGSRSHTTSGADHVTDFEALGLHRLRD